MVAVKTVAPSPGAATIPEQFYPGLPEVLAFPAGLAAKGWKNGIMYEEYARKVSPEGHPDFYSSGFVALMSVVAARRVVLPFKKKDYTPFTILLVAEPGMVAKTTCLAPIKFVLKASGLDWMYENESATPQVLVKEMSGHIPADYAKWDEFSQQVFKRRYAFAGQRGRFIGEFGDFLKKVLKDTGPMSDYNDFLLEMDDCHETYSKATLSRGGEVINNPYFAVAGAATPSNFRSIMLKNDELFGAGLFSRLTPVCPPAEFYVNSPMGLGEEEVPPALSSALTAWHKRLGIPTVSIEPIWDTDKKGQQVLTDKCEVGEITLPENKITFAPGVIEAWQRYRSFLKELAANELEEKELRASYVRLPVKLMRVLALIASLENDGVAEITHYAKAQELCETWRRSVHELYRQAKNPTHGKSLDDHILENLKKFADENLSPTSRELRQRSLILARAKSKLLDEHLSQLQKDGLILQTRQGKAVRYSLYVAPAPGKKNLKVVSSSPDNEQIDIEEIDLGFEE